jgi:biopolymer transport protein TolR
MRRARKPINQINVVPYIDVMLVLLVIFMITAPLIAPGEIQLPSVGTKLTVPLQPLEVTIEKDHTLSLRDRSGNGPKQKMSANDLVAHLLAKQQQGTEQPVVIIADGKVQYQEVMDVLSRLQQNGVRRVGLLARPSPT